MVKAQAVQCMPSSTTLDSHTGSDTTSSGVSGAVGAAAASRVLLPEDRRMRPKAAHSWGSSSSTWAAISGKVEEFVDMVLAYRR